LEIVSINVGQGDTTLIKAPNGLRILIDAGSVVDADQQNRPPNALHNISTVLDAYGGIDYLIITHYHEDHYGMVKEIITQYGLPRIAVLDRGGESKWGSSGVEDIPDDYLDYIFSKRNPNGVPSPGFQLDLGSGAYLELLSIGYPDNPFDGIKKVKLLGLPDVTCGSDEENGKSLVFLLRWNGFDMLLGGDTNEDIEPYLSQILLNQGVHVDAYKVHHHGSSTSSTQSFLNVLAPEISVCSVGHSGTYKHPRKDCYDRLYGLRSYIFQTNRGYDGSLSYPEPPMGYGYLSNGNITVKTQGQKSYTVAIPNLELTYSTDD
jgi:beta-lactamase superfamily II metal-dependent hydrolase